jgi:hypothetical protein
MRKDERAGPMAAFLGMQMVLHIASANAGPASANPTFGIARSTNKQIKSNVHAIFGICCLERI